MTKRTWWPVDWADERMPPGREEPDGFLINAEGHCWLGYPIDASDVSENDKRQFSSALSGGDIVQFMYCEELGAIEIALHKDGTFAIVQGAIDPRANSFWDGADSDSIAESLEYFAECYAEMERDIDREWPLAVTVLTAHWSDPIPHKLAIYNERLEVRPRFEQVSAAEARQ